MTYDHRYNITKDFVLQTLLMCPTHHSAGGPQSRVLRTTLLAALQQRADAELMAETGRGNEGNEGMGTLHQECLQNAQLLCFPARPQPQDTGKWA